MIKGISPTKPILSSLTKEKYHLNVNIDSNMLEEVSKSILKFPQALMPILDQCNLYISQNTKFVKTKDMKMQYDTAPMKDITFVHFTGKPRVFPSETSIVLK